MRLKTGASSEPSSWSLNEVTSLQPGRRFRRQAAWPFDAGGRHLPALFGGQTDRHGSGAPAGRGRPHEPWRFGVPLAPGFKPRLADGRVPEIAIQHLLTHSAGLTYVFMEPDGRPVSPAGFRTDSIAVTPTSMKSSGGFPPRRSATSRAADGAIPWRWMCSVRRSRRQRSSLSRKQWLTWSSNPLDMKDTGFAVVDTGRLVAHYADGTPEPRRMADDDQRGFPRKPRGLLPRSASGSEGVSIRGSGHGGNCERCPEVPGNPAGRRTAATKTRSDMFEVQARTRGQAEGPGWEFGFGGAVLVDPTAAGTPQARGRSNGTGPMVTNGSSIPRMSSPSWR